MALTANLHFDRLARFSLTTADATTLAAFYVQAFGCRRMGDDRLQGTAFQRLMGVASDARRVTLGLGSAVIELLEFDQPGAPYPGDCNSSEIIFHHLAIVTEDMTAAWLALLRTEGWSRITDGSPQQLPASSGDVTAFKFRDPEGHPLEFLSFPPNQTPRKWKMQNGGKCCLGIDHSAICITDTATSKAYYVAHGLSQSGCSHNTGVEQDQLDGLTGVTVEVTALSPARPTPHVELLCYDDVSGRASLRLASNDVATTRLVFESPDVTEPVRLLDPDGHHLIVIPT